MESYRQLFQRHNAPTGKNTAAPRSSKPLTETGWLAGPDQLVLIYQFTACNATPPSTVWVGWVTVTVSHLPPAFQLATQLPPPCPPPPPTLFAFLGYNIVTQHINFSNFHPATKQKSLNCINNNISIHKKNNSMPQFLRDFFSSIFNHFCTFQTS